MRLRLGNSLSVSQLVSGRLRLISNCLHREQMFLTTPHNAPKLQGSLKSQSSYPSLTLQHYCLHASMPLVFSTWNPLSVIKILPVAQGSAPMLLPQ